MQKTTRTRAITVGQVFTPKIRKSDKQRRRKENKVTERSNTFSPIKKLKAEYDMSQEYHTPDAKVDQIFHFFKIFKKNSPGKFNPYPSFTKDATFEDVMLAIKDKINKIFERENKKEKIWDLIYYDGQDIVLLDFINDYAMFYPLQTINLVEEEKYKRAIKYIFGALITEYGIEVFSNNNPISYHLEHLEQMEFEDELDEEVKECLNGWKSPEDVENLDKVGGKFPYYKLAQECIHEYAIGKDSNIEEILSNDNVYNDKGKQYLFTMFEVFLKLREYKFKLSDFYVDLSDQIKDDNPLYPEEYCIIIPGFDHVFQDYECHVNEKYGNSGAVPLCIEKRLTINGAETNRPLRPAIELLQDLSSCMMDVYNYYTE